VTYTTSTEQLAGVIVAELQRQSGVDAGPPGDMSSLWVAPELPWVQIDGWVNVNELITAIRNADSLSP
jgi:hypothetical protein